MDRSVSLLFPPSARVLLAGALLGCLVTGVTMGSVMSKQPVSWSPRVNPIAARSLVDAERAFARASVARGMRDAFLSVLAPDGIVFRPGPVNGRGWFTGRPATSGVLTWTPEYVAVSQAGDLGFTTGPWEFRRASIEEEPVAFGHYLSIWRRDPGAAWELRIDLGINHERPDSAPAEPVSAEDADTEPAPDEPVIQNAAAEPSVESADAPLSGPDPSVSEMSPPGRKPTLPDRGKPRASLLARDQALAGRVQDVGYHQAFAEFALPDVWVLREGRLPIVGIEAASRIAIDPALERSGNGATGTGTTSWVPHEAIVAVSGDLGSTRGEYRETREAPADSVDLGDYVRIWRTQPDGTWGLVLDLTTPARRVPAE